VPYRDSKLTRLLQGCLGGAARTAVGEWGIRHMSYVICANYASYAYVGHMLICHMSYVLIMLCHMPYAICYNAIQICMKPTPFMLCYML
jgi:hypothetical protein